MPADVKWAQGVLDRFRADRVRFAHTGQYEAHSALLEWQWPWLRALDYLVDESATGRGLPPAVTLERIIQTERLDT